MNKPKTVKLFTTKIKVYSVETDSPRILIVFQSWAYDHVISGFEFPNFSFHKAKDEIFLNFINFRMLNEDLLLEFRR